ncbi:MAG: hypothetical protein LUE29_13220 [Lachnospiraceae bacterium]|nr:hypothetical protein [Lachnospiraceae bacterium]
MTAERKTERKEVCPEDNISQRKTNEQKRRSQKKSVVRCSLCVAWVNLRKMAKSASFAVLLVYTLLFWFLFTSNIKAFAGANGYAVTPYLLPHFFAGGTYQVYGKLMLVILMCNVPFLDKTRIYSVPRTGRIPWGIGQMIYIVLANILFQIIFFAAQILALLPYVGISDKWGSVLYTIANDPTVLYSWQGFGTVNSDIVLQMTPLEAMGKQMLLCILLGCVIGAGTFLVNGLTGKNFGAVVMAGCVFAAEVFANIDLLFGTELSEHYMFGWMQLQFYTDGTYSLRQNLLVMLAAFLLLAAFGLLCVAKRWIRAVE